MAEAYLWPGTGDALGYSPVVGASSSARNTLASRWLVRFSVFLLALAAVWTVRIAAENQHLVAVSGTIVDRDIRVEPGQARAIPIVEFEGIDGQKLRTEGAAQGFDSPFGLGRSVDVWYDPTDPDRATLDDPAARYAAPGAVGTAALALLIASIVARRQYPRSAAE